MVVLELVSIFFKRLDSLVIQPCDEVVESSSLIEKLNDFSE